MEFISQINDFSYKLYLNTENSYSIYKYILKIIPNSYFDSSNNCVFFTSEKIISLTDDLKNVGFKYSYQSCVKMIHCLSIQINYLKELGYSFYGFDLNDIVLIDNQYIILNPNYLEPIFENNIFIINVINHPYFANPELYNLTKLPIKINYKSCYYSLGVLIIYCLLNTYLLVGHELKNDFEINIVLEPIKNTKLYWFLKRCLDQNVENRTLLYI
jgi:hypothetical protein